MNNPNPNPNRLTNNPANTTNTGANMTDSNPNPSLRITITDGAHAGYVKDYSSEEYTKVLRAISICTDNGWSYTAEPLFLVTILSGRHEGHAKALTDAEAREAIAKCIAQDWEHSVAPPLPETDAPAVESTALTLSPPAAPPAPEPAIVRPAPINRAGKWERWTSSRSTRQGRHLEEVRDLLRHRRGVDQPEDTYRSPSQTILRVDGARPTVQFMSPDGLSEPMTISDHALAQWAGFVMPTKKVGLNTFMHLARLGGETERGNTAGSELATMALSMFGQEYASPLMWRAVQHAGSGHIRALLSETYTLYDNLDFVEDVLNTLGSRADMFRVVSYAISGNDMRVRMVGGNADALQTWQGREVNKPIPMVELWNGEGGGRAVRVKGGGWQFDCSNGMGHWNKSSIWRAIHAHTTTAEVREKVGAAITEQMVIGEGVVDNFCRALDTRINDAFGWFLSGFEDSVSKAQAERVGIALQNEPTVNRGPNGEFLLASVVDAITYVAQEEINLYEQADLEHIGARVLHAGLAQAGETGRINHRV